MSLDHTMTRSVPAVDPFDTHAEFANQCSPIVLLDSLTKLTAVFPVLACAYGIYG